MTRILIADDHPIIVSGLKAVLFETDYEVVASVSDGSDVVSAAAQTQPDILILDVSMPNRSGLDVLRVLRSRGDGTKVVLLTAGIEDAQLVEAMRLGVDGIVLKEGAHNLLIPCLDAVRDGGRWMEPGLMQRALDLTMAGGASPDPFDGLTPRERVIASRVTQGLRNRHIADELNINEGTVKAYLHRIYRKLGVGSRTELAILTRDK
jgi:two-component system nitrate/nitrite response regulator NarP